MVERERQASPIRQSSEPPAHHASRAVSGLAAVASVKGWVGGVPFAAPALTDLQCASNPLTPETPHSSPAHTALTCGDDRNDHTARTENATGPGQRGPEAVEKRPG